MSHSGENPASLEPYLRYWWLLVVFMLLGVATGWVLQRGRPPLYEARAEIGLNVDLSRTGTLSDLNQDILVNTTGRVINSLPVMDALRSDAKRLGELSEDSSGSREFFLERKAESYVLRVQSRDPGIALTLADRWSELAMRALESASLHAIQADLYQRYLDSLAVCLQQIPAGTMDEVSCGQANLSGLQVEIEQTGAALLQARANSRGVVPGMHFNLDQPAYLLNQPVQYDRKFFLIGGLALGFACGMIFLQTGLPVRLFRKMRRG